MPASTPGRRGPVRGGRFLGGLPAPAGAYLIQARLLGRRAQVVVHARRPRWDRAARLRWPTRRARTATRPRRSGRDRAARWQWPTRRARTASRHRLATPARTARGNRTPGRKRPTARNRTAARHRTAGRNRTTAWNRTGPRSRTIAWIRTAPRNRAAGWGRIAKRRRGRPPGRPLVPRPWPRRGSRASGPAPAGSGSCVVVIRFWIGFAAAPAEQTAPPAAASGVAVPAGIIVRPRVQEVGAAEVLAPRRSTSSPGHAAFRGLAGRHRAGRVTPGKISAAPAAPVGRLVRGLAGRRSLIAPAGPGTAVGVKVTRPARLLTRWRGPPAPPRASCWRHIIRPVVIGPVPGLPARIVSPASWIVPNRAGLAAATRIPPATRILPGITRSARRGRRVTTAVPAGVRSPSLTRGCLARRGGPGVAGHLA
jgi:hypothetical protein